MRILHFGGVRLGAAHPEWPEAGEKIRLLQRNVLVKAFERATALDVSMLLCSGDLFDSNAVGLSDVKFVLDVCRDFPRQNLVILPGGRDPWAPYCAHRHLVGHRTPNLLVLFPESACPTRHPSGIWIYGIPEDVSTTHTKSIKQLERKADAGWHLAVAYGSRGRLKPGPEEGMIMAAPEVAGHPFDYLALADGGPAERVGTSKRPACYAAPLVAMETLSGRQAGSGWLLTLSGLDPVVEPIQLDAIAHATMEVDVTRLSGTPAIAQAIRREAGAGTLFDVRLVGTRSMLNPILEPDLVALCAEDLLGLRILDESRLAAPDDLASAPPLLRALWQVYSEVPDRERGHVRDAIQLAAAGHMDPLRWKEAPWARSS